jgi:Fe-S oxidoreductase
VLNRSVTALDESARAGVPIVGLEPSCTAVFRSDAVELLDNGESANAVASSVRTLAELLGSTDGWEPPQLAGVDAVVQPHCHHRAVLGFDADLEILRRAGITSRVVAGCCGLAGNFGAERGHYDVSVAIAGNDLLPAVEQADANAPVLTDGFSCRTQLHDVTGRVGIHLAELLDTKGDETSRH